ncbi:MAG: methionyl-tRNA formyltransferase [Balneolales bacterium]
MTVKSLNIVFMGNPDFAVPSLERLLNSSHRVSAVVTGPDKRRGRGGKRTPTPVKLTALNAGIPVLEAEDVRNESFVSRLEALHPDLFVVVAFKILPPEVLAIPVVGSVNLHASLLPKYRGAAPIHHAVIHGESETGCTVFMLDQGMDTGAVLSQTRTPIPTLTTTGELYRQLMNDGAKLLVNTVDEISEGRYSAQPQDSRLASPAPKITVEDARIDFEKDCVSVHNLIRGMSPVPGAWTNFEGKKIKIFRSEPAPNINLPPGRAELISGSGYAGCISGSITLLEIQLEGKRPMKGYDFLNGTGGRAQFLKR